MTGGVPVDHDYLPNPPVYLRLYKQRNVQNAYPLSTQPTLEDAYGHSPADSRMYYRVEFSPLLLVSKYNLSEFRAIKGPILSQDIGSKR